MLTFLQKEVIWEQCLSLSILHRVLHTNEAIRNVKGTVRIWLLKLSSQLKRKKQVTNLSKPDIPCAKATITIPPRSLLPNQINHVVQPGKPDMPRRKHTSAEVAVAEAEKGKSPSSTHLPHDNCCVQPLSHDLQIEVVPRIKNMLLGS
jgi:hypothetical protein